jgi:hypothetical protein
MQTHLQVVAGASEIPLTLLLGQAPAGLNATGDNDVRNFYDSVRQFQTTDLQDSLSSVDEALVRSTLGDLPDGVVYEWDPLWQMSEAEKAAVSKTKMDSVQIIVNTNLFAQEELRPAVADMLIDDGLLPSLDQHMLSEDEMAELLNANMPGPGEEQQAEVDPKTGQPVDPQPQPLKVVTGGKTDADPFDESQHERDYEAYVEGVLPSPEEDLAIRRKAIEEEIPTYHDKPEDVPPLPFTTIPEPDGPGDVSDIDDRDNI